MSITGQSIFRATPSVYIGVPEVTERLRNRASDNRDFERMRKVMRLRQEAHWTHDAGQWCRIMDHVEQIRTGLTYPKTGTL